MSKLPFEIVSTFHSDHFRSITYSKRNIYISNTWQYHYSKLFFYFSIYSSVFWPKQNRESFSWQDSLSIDEK